MTIDWDLYQNRVATLSEAQRVEELVCWQTINEAWRKNKAWADQYGLSEISEICGQAIADNQKSIDILESSWRR